jgi:hypothetical protein
MSLILTTADRTHQKSVLQLLSSLAKHQPEASVVCHDLGMEADYLRRVADLAELRAWNFDPDWTQVRNRGRFHAGAYGWKPRMLAAACLRDGPEEIAWLDAGTLVSAALGPAFAIASRIGVCSPASSGRTGDWCHDGLAAQLSLAARSDLLWGPCRSAGALFMRMDFPGVTDLLFDWLRLSALPEIIAPPGCSTANHRYDQSLLNLLLESRGFNGAAVDHCAGFHMHCDID